MFLIIPRLRLLLVLYCAFVAFVVFFVVLRVFEYGVSLLTCTTVRMILWFTFGKRIWTHQIGPSLNVVGQDVRTKSPLVHSAFGCRMFVAYIRNPSIVFFPNCQYRLGGPKQKAFGSQADLNRHGLSKSHASPVYCDKPSYTGKDNLNRRDRLNKHNREYHGPILLPLPVVLEENALEMYFTDFPPRQK